MSSPTRGCGRNRPVPLVSPSDFDAGFGDTPLGRCKVARRRPFAVKLARDNAPVAEKPRVCAPLTQGRQRDGATSTIHPLERKL